mmetsp:Transcript_63000/g.112534  ORF Transcript_63000/g.112534 Transcript_63000/m.112534 type:complete len:141 (-) Transcript_63000:775-1197(-)
MPTTSGCTLTAVKQLTGQHKPLSTHGEALGCLPCCTMSGVPALCTTLPRGMNTFSAEDGREVTDVDPPLRTKDTRLGIGDNERGGIVPTAAACGKDARPGTGDACTDGTIGVEPPPGGAYDTDGMLDLVGELARASGAPS